VFNESMFTVSAGLTIISGTRPATSDHILSSATPPTVPFTTR